MGITGFMATYLLPEILPSFKNEYPNIEMFIMEQNTTLLEEALLDGTIDFAIMHSHPLEDNKNIKHELLYKDPFVLVTKKNHPLSKFSKNDKNYVYPFIDLNLFKDENFILLDKNKRIRQISDIIFNITGMNPNVSLTLKSFETARRLASTGYGVTLIPMQYIEIFTAQYDADYYFIDNNNFAYWDTCIATNPNMYLSKASKVFINMVLKHFKTNQPI